MTRPALSLVFTLLLACGGGAPPTADLAALSDDEIAQRAIAFMDEMIAAGTPHLADCDALAGALRPVVERNQPLLEVMNRYKNDPAKKQWFDEHYGAQAKERGMWMQSQVLPACGQHPGVKSVLAAMR